MNVKQSIPATPNAQKLHPPGEKLRPASDLVEYCRQYARGEAGSRRALVLRYRHRPGVETEAVVSGQIDHSARPLEFGQWRKHPQYLAGSLPSFLTGTVVGVVVVSRLYWAQTVFIPVALAVFLTFLLAPLVTALSGAA